MNDKNIRMAGILRNRSKRDIFAEMESYVCDVELVTEELFLSIADNIFKLI